MPARILVVDDSPASVKVLEAKLTSEYYDVLTATDGATAHDPFPIGNEGVRVTVTLSIGISHALGEDDTPG